MKNTDKLLVAKLKELKEILNDSEDKDVAIRELHSIYDTVIEDHKKNVLDKWYDFAKEKRMDVFAIGNEIKLCNLREEDRDSYIKLQKENAIMPRAFKMDGFEDLLWGEVCDEKVFYVSVRRRTDDVYMGYCSIKNIQKDDLELAVELLKEFHGHGYGRQALTLFLISIKEYAGIDSFKALVDGENISSQKMCEACGGKPSGIAEYLLHDKEYMEEYEQENQNEITDQMRETAKKFSVSPEKLLTHVLVYRFKI